VVQTILGGFFMVPNNEFFKGVPMLDMQRD